MRRTPHERNPLYWVVPGELAGRPGPHKMRWDLWYLASRNLKGIVSLDGPIADDFTAVGIRHFPAYLPMTALEAGAARQSFLGALDPIFAFVADCHQLGAAVLVHCFHGNDRTGAVLACCLIALYGMSSPDAVAAVRTVNPAAMSALGYEEAVHLFGRSRDG